MQLRAARPKAEPARCLRHRGGEKVCEVGKTPAGIFDLMRKNSATGIPGPQVTRIPHVTLGTESLDTCGTSSLQLEPVPSRVAEPRWSRARFHLALDHLGSATDRKSTRLNSS